MNFIGKTICNTKYIIDTQFSKGTSGTIYNIKDNKKLLVKIIEIRNYNNREQALREIGFMTKASALLITPKIYNVKFCKLNCKSYVFIVMEKYGDGTLEDMFSAFNEMNFNRYKNDNLLQNIGKSITKLFDKLYSVNIFHGDLHAQNILFKLSKSGNLQFRIIDFGYSKKASNYEYFNRENNCIQSLNGKKCLKKNNILKSKYIKNFIL